MREDDWWMMMMLPLMVMGMIVLLMMRMMSAIQEETLCYKTWTRVHVTVVDSHGNNAEIQMKNDERFLTML
jgi:hypothetical protein